MPRPETLRVAPRPRPLGAPTRRVCEAAAALGVLLEDLPDRAPVGDDLALPAAPGALTLVTGPSGAGKSALLEDVARSLDESGARWRRIGRARAPRRARPLVDAIGSDTPSAMRALARAGLADMAAFATRTDALSEGQRWRFRLARLFDRAERDRAPSWILIDDFADALDPANARGVAALTRRFLDRAPGVRAVVATGRAELGPALDPDAVVTVDPASAPAVRPRQRAGGAPGVEISRGDLADYAALAAAHYRPGRPRAPERVLVARDRASGARAGVLVLCRPTLNAAGRHAAWPGRYPPGRPAEAARRVNTELRRVARVIVAPAHRGLGVARALVEAHLADPPTPCTEAIAAMGAACPFFRAAGMTEYRTAPTRRDARLLDALAHAGVDRWRLPDPRAALDRAARTAGRDFIERELRVWANASRATRRHTGDPLADLARRACCRAVAATPVYYAHTAGA